MSHFKKLAVGGLVFLAFVMVPAASSAASVSELQAQIASLLAQVQVLQSQLVAMTGGGTTLTTPMNSPCLQLSYNLYPGASDASTGGDVSKLQQFLAQDSSASYSAGVTGYYGPATQAAVQRWQASRGVVSSGPITTTGYGAVGSQTRSVMAQRCPTNPPDKTDPLYPYPGVSASFDQSSLFTSSSRPTITGTASGVSSVYITITGGGQLGASQGEGPGVTLR